MFAAGQALRRRGRRRSQETSGRNDGVYPLGLPESLQRGGGDPEPDVIDRLGTRGPLALVWVNFLLADMAEGFGEERLLDTESGLLQGRKHRTGGGQESASASLDHNAQSAEQRHVERLGASATPLIVEHGPVALVRHAIGNHARFACAEVPGHDLGRNRFVLDGPESRMPGKNLRKRIVRLGLELAKDRLRNGYDFGKPRQEVELRNPMEKDEGRAVYDEPANQPSSSAISSSGVIWRAGTLRRASSSRKS